MTRDLGIGAPRRPRDDDDESPAFHEKRRAVRRQLGVRCWMADGKNTVYGRVHDVSMGGLCINVPVRFSTDVELDLALVLPDSEVEPNGSIAVRAHGRVVWSRDHQGGLRLGARFTEFVTGRGALSSALSG